MSGKIGQTLMIMVVQAIKAAMRTAGLTKDQKRIFLKAFKENVMENYDLADDDGGETTIQ